MTEQHTITVTAYRTPEGKPTCAENFDEGRVCMMLRSTRWGLADVCALDVDRGRKANGLQRDNGGNGYLIPCAGCPVWGEVQS